MNTIFLTKTDKCFNFIKKSCALRMTLLLFIYIYIYIYIYCISQFEPYKKSSS